ncbi:adenosine deaminase [Paenibacillus tengchongensis]|uniref:adenosine deaminase n=1 Tax=Paenibacillus tengchongensis TaxID=2608684 RepID=UPI00124E4055|nr:adenosine deaminase [Paenibacillus tengchongensis]
MKQQFMDSLESGSLQGVQNVPKSDLHNHAGRGGSIRYIEEWAGVKVEPPPAVFDSLGGMANWFNSHVKSVCPGTPGYLKRVEASFVQAGEDRISLLALSFGIDEIDALGGMESFMKTMNGFRERYATDTRFLPELAFDRACNADAVFERLDEILGYGWFRSVDICCDELAAPVNKFKRIYRKAKAAGLVLKAHVGEFGSADDVMKAVEELELHEVHHGVAAAKSPQIMHWLADHRIRLNVCPTSNVMLGVAESYASHPIRKLFDNGVPVTVNSDDLLIFNQSVSQEYMNLYRCGLMTAEELNRVRETGLLVQD